MSYFKNKVVWITGASSGIGEALVKVFAQEGAIIVLSARRKEALMSIADELNLGADKVLVLPLDLSDTSQIDKLTQQVIDTFGRIDILVNNGGISQRSETKDTPISIDRKIMEVNFFGTVALTKSVLPIMLKQQSGNIVVTSSIAGKFGFYFRSAYSASKHALHGFFESLRMEVYDDNIKVMLVCPGKIQTNISLNAITEDGTAHSKMDESMEKGLPVDQCAIEILAGIRSGKEELLVGGKELKSVWVKRIFPKLFSKLIRKQTPE